MTGWLVGAYSASPSRNFWDPLAESRYLNAVTTLPGATGQEIPFTGSLHRWDEAWFLDQLDPNSEAVITTMPGTMNHLRASPNFGLASPDIDGREKALDFLSLTAQAVKRLNGAVGRQAVIAVEIHSSPRAIASEEAFFESLVELTTWDWGGARLVVEHCDTTVPGHAPARGFLPLETEIEVIGTINRAQNAAVGIAINWGRSAIEGRSPHTPTKHAALAAAAGLLSGLTFSGCSSRATSLGDAWADVHVPPGPGTGDDGLESSSLMTDEHIRSMYLAAEPASLLFRAIKVAAPPDATVDERIGVIADSLRLVREAVADG